nr:uncharacterized protein LOC117228202 [Megalopta genalis]
MLAASEKDHAAFPGVEVRLDRVQEVRAGLDHGHGRRLIQRMAEKTKQRKLGLEMKMWRNQKKNQKGKIWMEAVSMMKRRRKKMMTDLERKRRKISTAASS